MNNNIYNNTETLNTLMDINDEITSICIHNPGNSCRSIHMRNTMLGTCLNRIEKICEELNKPEQADKISEERYYTVCIALYNTAALLFDTYVSFGMSAQERRVFKNKIHSLSSVGVDTHDINAIEMAYNAYFEESGEDNEIMVIPEMFVDERLIGFTDDAFFAFAHARANQLIAEFPDRRFMLPGLTAMLI